MSEAVFPTRMRAQTTTLKSGIAFGIASLGAIPIRYGQQRFPVLRRRFQDDNQEQRLLALGKAAGIDGPPEIFGLASFSAIGKQDGMVQGNQTALRGSVNLVKTNGEKVRLSGAYAQATCTANIYANAFDPLFYWVQSVLEYPSIRGISEFADGTGVPVLAEIEKQFDWADPIERTNTGAPFTDYLYNISVTFTIRTIAARVETAPLFKGTVLEMKVDDVRELQAIEIPAVDQSDWP